MNWLRTGNCRKLQSNAQEKTASCNKHEAAKVQGGWYAETYQSSQAMRGAPAGHHQSSLPQKQFKGWRFGLSETLRYPASNETVGVNVHADPHPLWESECAKPVANHLLHLGTAPRIQQQAIAIAPTQQCHGGRGWAKDLHIR